MSFLSKMLAHPLTKGLSLDDPETTALRSRIIHEKIFLRKIYESWYQLLVSHIPEGSGSVLEVGSGGGFLKELQEDALASEVFLVPNINIVLNAMALPFKHESLRAVLMVDVLHHIPNPALFFSEAARCVKSGGRCLFIEPWNTPWGKCVYQNLHHEPFNPEGGWTIPSSGALSGANGALPWILFERDRQLFVEKFPQWRIVEVSPMMPLAYLISGGVSMRSIMPGWAYLLVRAFEKVIPSVEKKSGMFAFIMLERI